jgi:hypothetical protein
MLISKKPFSDDDLITVDSLCREFDFERVLTPSSVTDSVFLTLTSSKEDRKKFNNDFPVDIKSPSDDKPFYFHYMKFTDVFNISFWKSWDMDFNAKAVFILLTLAGTMISLTFLCVVVPLKLTSK